MNSRFLITAFFLFGGFPFALLSAAPNDAPNPIPNLARGLCLSCHSIDGEIEASAPAFSEILNAYRLPKKATPESIAQAIAAYANNPQKAKHRLPRKTRAAQMTAIQLPPEQLLAIAQYFQSLFPPTP